MNLYEVVYQDRTGKQFKRIIWANSDEAAWARAQLGKKSSVIISFQKIHDFKQKMPPQVL